MDPGDELVDIVDEDDRVVDTLSRREMRERGLLHRATSIMVTRTDGEIFVHRRSETKDVAPGLYDMFVGGVVAAGETYDLCAIRELAEEVGVTGVPLRYRGKHLFEGATVSNWTSVYDVVWDGPITPQPEEVAWGKFVSPPELDGMLVERSFCPDSLEIFELVRGDRLRK